MSAPRPDAPPAVRALRIRHNPLVLALASTPSLGLLAPRALARLAAVAWLGGAGLGLGCGATVGPEAPGGARTPAATKVAAVAEPVDPLAESALMADVAWLAAPEQRGRGSATPDEARAAAWLAAGLERAGVPPLPGMPYLHPFATRGGGSSQNVVGVIAPAAPRDERVIVLGAHHDHVGLQRGALHPGADDNASGVAVVLGIARHLARHPDLLGRRLVVVFFGAEEIGLLGSWAFVRTPTLPLESIEAMVALDMLGRPLVDQPPLRLAAKLLGIDAMRSVGVDGLRGRPWLESIVREACATEGHAAVTIDDLPEVIRRAASRISRGRSDHFPFEQSGVPAVIFGDGESSDYHQPTDTVPTLDGALLVTRARVVLRTVLALSRTDRPATPLPP